MKPIARAFSISLMMLVAHAVCGQNYPDKPVRLLGSLPGGGSDLLMRLIAPPLATFLGQPVVIDNRPANLLGEIGSKAPPDGYTAIVVGTSFVIGPLLFKTSWDPLRDFAPITLVDRAPNLLVVHPSVPAKSVKELIALAKTKPGQLNYASGAIGGGPHLSGELFKSMAGVNIVHIPYKGNPPALTNLIAGEVQMMFPNTSAAMPYVKSGRLRAVAVTSAQPSPLVPGLPTVAASGLPGYESSTMDAVVAPAKTPATIINRLHQDIVRVLAQAPVQETLFNQGTVVVGSTPEELEKFFKSETVKWGKVIKEAGIRVE